MMSVVDVPESIPKKMISTSGSKVKITAAKVEKDVRTQMGVTRLALFVNVAIDGEKGEYSHMFSLDKEPVAGSAGRVLSRAKFKNVSELNDKTIQKLIGMEFTVTNKMDKLYWS